MTKAPKLKKENGLIDWSRTAEQVCNQIRAMQPWPTAYTFLHSKGKPAMRLIVSGATSQDRADRQLRRSARVLGRRWLAPTRSTS